MAVSRILSGIAALSSVFAMSVAAQTAPAIDRPPVFSCKNDAGGRSAQMYDIGDYYVINLAQGKQARGFHMIPNGISAVALAQGWCDGLRL